MQGLTPPNQITPNQSRQITANSIPVAVRGTNGRLTMSTIPRPHDFMDTCIEYSKYGSLALIGGGGFGALTNYLSSNTDTCPAGETCSQNLAGTFFCIGLVWAALTNLAIMLNDSRHTANFDNAYEQQQALIINSSKP